MDRSFTLDQFSYTTWGNPALVAFLFFFINEPAPPELYPFPLPDPLPIFPRNQPLHVVVVQEVLLPHPRVHDGRESLAVEIAAQPFLDRGAESLLGAMDDLLGQDPGH